MVVWIWPVHPLPRTWQRREALPSPNKNPINSYFSVFKVKDTTLDIWGLDLINSIGISLPIPDFLPILSLLVLLGPDIWKRAWLCSSRTLFTKTGWCGPLVLVCWSLPYMIKTCLSPHFWCRLLPLTFSLNLFCPCRTSAACWVCQTSSYLGDLVPCCCVSSKCSSPGIPLAHWALH